MKMIKIKPEIVYNEPDERRVIFPVSKQKEFLLYIKDNLKLTWKEIIINLDGKSLKNYQNEKCTISLKITKELCEMVNENFEKILSLYGAKIVDKIIPRPFGGIGHSKKRIKKTNIKFTNKELSLDISNIEMSRFDKKKGIILPTRLTPFLAEEIGIHLGDGFMSSKKNDFRVKGHKIDEVWYYIDYLKPLYKYLYNIELKIKNYTDTIGFEIYSQAICQFKIKVLGIKAGRKSDLYLPKIIKVKDEKILCRFLRGFFDTDGCVYFSAKHKKEHYYPSISIAQKSRKIIEEVGEILLMLGFNPRVYHYKEISEIMLYGYSQFKHFNKKIGWSSPKHLKKVEAWEKKYGGRRTSNH